MNHHNKYPVAMGFCAGFILFAFTRHEVAARPPAGESFLMCSPGKVVFSESFTPGNVSERWGIRASYEIDEGILKRTEHEPQDTARTFLKEAAFHDVIFRFDFRFEGASEIRLMTGGGGGYNTVTQISPGHFQVNTAKRSNKFAPSMQGECAFDFEEGKWHTMTVEFHQILARRSAGAREPQNQRTIEHRILFVPQNSQRSAARLGQFARQHTQRRARIRPTDPDYGNRARRRAARQGENRVGHRNRFNIAVCAQPALVSSGLLEPGARLACAPSMKLWNSLKPAWPMGANWRAYS